MGWKGVVRSMEVSRRQVVKEAERNQKYQAKLRLLNEADFAVYEQNKHIKRITSIHKYCRSKEIDWKEIAKQIAPLEPKHLNYNETKAQHKYDNYSPSLLDKVFRMENRKKEKLLKSIKKSILDDEQEYLNNLEQYHNEFALWQKQNNLAQRLLNKDFRVYMDVVRELNPSVKIKNLFSDIKFTVNDNGSFVTHIVVSNEEIVPKEKYTLRQSGNISVKSMPKSEFNKIYQDYVCSCVLRVAAELFCILPIEQIYINANSNLLNAKTGYIEEQTILSVMVMRKTLKSLNVAMIDPSEAMKNFVHNMEFKNTTGFEVVESVAFM